MGSLDLKKQARLKRKRRIRKKVRGNESRPRLCVFRSARHTYAQVIDDSQGRTLAAASTLARSADFRISVPLLHRAASFQDLRLPLNLAS